MRGISYHDSSKMSCTILNCISAEITFHHIHSVAGDTSMMLDDTVWILCI